MSKEIHPTIHLEITLPHMTFPTINQHGNPNERKAQTEQHSSEKRNADTDEQVQVRLLPLARQSGTEQIPALMGEHFSISTRKGQFQLQRIKNIAAQGRRYLLQVLRQCQQTSGEKEPEQYNVTDELGFSLIYQYPQVNATSQIEIIPGLNQVVVFLDTENTPISYSIDGAENE